MHFKNSEKPKRAEEFHYKDLITIENLFQAWSEFRSGKRKKPDVQTFERNLEDNLFNLYHRLKTKIYRHGSYEEFYVNDPKRRHIHKAQVCDRVLHHLLYTYLYEVFDKTFISDSYSCRLNKGTHRAVKRLEIFARKTSKNYTRECFAIKLDIKKFFASVDHAILIKMLSKKIKDPDILRLLYEVIDSFVTEDEIGRGIPLGNLTSQVFANIYMNELDQFVKHELKIKYYLRYADDFICISNNKNELEDHVEIVTKFLSEKLKLKLHPNKIIFRKLRWGIDFLGYIVLPRYVLPRAKTKRRILKKIEKKTDSENFEQAFQSYLGYLSHACSHKLTQELKNQIWLWRKEKNSRAKICCCKNTTLTNVH